MNPIFNVVDGRGAHTCADSTCGQVSARLEWWPAPRGDAGLAERLPAVGAVGQQFLDPPRWMRADPVEALERQVIGVLADRHVRHQPRPGQALLDRLGEPLGDHDVVPAGGAGIFGADVLKHDQRRGDILELLDQGPSISLTSRAVQETGTSRTYRYSGRSFRLTDVHGRVVQEILGV